MPNSTPYSLLVAVLILVPSIGLSQELSASRIMENNFYAAKFPHLTTESTMTLINEMTKLATLPIETGRLAVYPDRLAE